MADEYQLIIEDFEPEEILKEVKINGKIKDFFKIDFSKDVDKVYLMKDIINYLYSEVNSLKKQLVKIKKQVGIQND